MRMFGLRRVTKDSPRGGVRVLINNELLREKSINPDGPNVLQQLLGEDVGGIFSMLGKIQTGKSEERDDSHKSKLQKEMTKHLHRQLTVMDSKARLDALTSDAPKDDDSEEVKKTKFDKMIQIADNLIEAFDGIEDECTGNGISVDEKPGVVIEELDDDTEILNREVKLKALQKIMKKKNDEELKTRQSTEKSEVNPGREVVQSEKIVKPAKKRAGKKQVPVVQNNEIVKREEESPRPRKERESIKAIMRKNKDRQNDVLLKALVSQKARQKSSFSVISSGSKGIEKSGLCLIRKKSEAASDNSSYLTLLDSCNQFIILAGPPGSGKTTVLKDILFQFYRCKPLQIEKLNEFDTLVRYCCKDSTVKDLEGVINLNFPDCIQDLTASLTIQSLLRLHVLYLIDGFDEVNPVSSIAMTVLFKHIQVACTRGGSAVIISTRTHAVPELYRFLAQNNVPKDDIQYEEIVYPQE